MANKNWENSEYTKLVRIKADDLEYLKLNKEDMSAAGFLNYIINLYKNKSKK
jgi:hypothetical protein